jgi:signal transduction histidine kinase
MNSDADNLVANSVDTIDGQGRIDIRTDAADSGYQIVVTDTAMAFRLTFRRVTDSFGTTKSLRQRTGFNWSIAYPIVRTHSGRLE